MNSMIIYLYCVRDLVSGVFNPPMYFVTDIDAIRWFRTQCYSDPVLYHNRNDFELVCLGTFDRENGDFSVLQHRSVLFGSSVKQMVVDEQAEFTDDSA